MIYRLAAWLPAYQGEVRSVVIGMALDAIFARSFCSDPNRMHAAILRQPVSNFGVAIETFELHATRAEIVALSATQHPGERFMRLCQRPRRDLRASRGGIHAESYQENGCKKIARQGASGPIRCV